MTAQLVTYLCWQYILSMQFSRQLVYDPKRCQSSSYMYILAWPLFQVQQKLMEVKWCSYNCVQCFNQTCCWKRRGLADGFEARLVFALLYLCLFTQHFSLHPRWYINRYQQQTAGSNPVMDCNTSRKAEQWYSWLLLSSETGLSSGHQGLLKSNFTSWSEV